MEDKDKVDIKVEESTTTTTTTTTPPTVTVAEALLVAADKAKEIILVAAQTAQELAAKTQEQEDKVAKDLAVALRDVFGENEDAKRFIDVSRIPLLCKSVLDIHKNIDEIKDNIRWMTRLVVGTVVVALIGFVFKQ